MVAPPEVSGSSRTVSVMLSHPETANSITNNNRTIFSSDKILLRSAIQQIKVNSRNIVQLSLNPRY